MIKNERGFTLIEILVTLAITSIAMTAIYSAYITQLRSYAVQQEIAMMQQNLRAGISMLAGELRMAGHDPKGKKEAGIQTLNKYVNDGDQAEIRFTLDENGDGDIVDPGEDLTYSLYTSDGIQKLGRKNPTTNMPVVDHIDRFHLYYLDRDGAETTVPGDIRSVQITLVAQTSKVDNKFNSSFTYQDLQGASYTIAADGYRRAALSTHIQCRNMGLQ